MEQSSWEADSRSASQIHRLLQNLKVYYRVHRSVLTVPVLGRMNLLYILFV
jgi:hypothetical protein